jgi:glycosyltransferase involved in cell wall biosynthesis
MPKALLLITGIFPPDSGGPAKFAMEFGKWASIQGFQVKIQTYSDMSIKNQSSDFFKLRAVSRTHHIFIRYIKMIQAIGTSVESGTHVLSVGAFLETYLASIIYRFSYVTKVPGDIVWERARNHGVTKLGIEDFQNEKLKLKYRLFRVLYTRSLRRAPLVIVPSMGLYKLCVRWGVSETKLRLIYNSVGGEFNSGEEVVEKKFDLITVCRLTAWKGVDELIDYAALRNVSLLVLGDGPDRERLERLAAALNAKVEFEGKVTPQGVYNFLIQSKLFVLNSYYEGLPHALVEARVAGVLSVGRSGTGSEEVISDDLDGFLIRRDRPLKETLDKALAIWQESHTMISAAKDDSLQRFNKENNFTAILNETVSGGL